MDVDVSVCVCSVKCTKLKVFDKYAFYLFLHKGLEKDLHRVTFQLHLYRLLLIIESYLCLADILVYHCYLGLQNVGFHFPNL